MTAKSMFLVAVTALVTATAAAAAAPPLAPKVITVCPPQMRALVRSLSTIDGYLAVGISHAKYETYLSKAHVAYTLVPWNQASPECISYVGLRAERALNDYMKADKSWSACLSQITNGFLRACVSGSGENGRQAYWADASVNLRRAIDNLG